MNLKHKKKVYNEYCNSFNIYMLADGDGSLLSYLLNLKDDGSPNPIGFHLTINNIKAIIQVN